MRKKLIVSEDDKRLMAAQVLCVNIINLLDEVVDENGNIGLYDNDNEFPELYIEKDGNCWVDIEFLKDLATEFDIDELYLKHRIITWVENTYQINVINFGWMI